MTGSWLGWKDCGLDARLLSRYDLCSYGFILLSCGRNRVRCFVSPIAIWHGWHRNAALTCMALMLLVEERLLHLDDLPLLSARNIRDLIASPLLRNDQDPDSVIAAIAHRHRYRAEDINRRYTSRVHERTTKSVGIRRRGINLGCDTDDLFLIGLKCY